MRGSSLGTRPGCLRRAESARPCTSNISRHLLVSQPHHQHQAYTIYAIHPCALSHRRHQCALRVLFSPHPNTFTSILANTIELFRIKQLDAHSGAHESAPIHRAAADSTRRLLVLVRLVLCHGAARAPSRAAPKARLPRRQSLAAPRSLAQWRRCPAAGRGRR